MLDHIQATLDCVVLGCNGQRRVQHYGRVFNSPEAAVAFGCHTQRVAAQRSQPVNLTAKQETPRWQWSQKRATVVARTRSSSPRVFRSEWPRAHHKNTDAMVERMFDRGTLPTET